MDMFDLELFLRVAEEGSITKAAELMHLSQPTVSRRIIELEQTLNRLLFTRTNKAVVLTPEGRQFLEAASDILTIYNKTVQREHERQLTGDLFIGSGEIPAFSRLAKLIGAFRQKEPGVCFHLLSGNAEEIRENVEKGVLDLGLLTRSVNTENFESLEFPEKAHWGILMREDHPLARQKTLRPEDLRGEPLILPENRVYQREWTEWIAGEVNLAAGYTLAHNAIQLVKQGLGSMLCFEDPSLLSEGLTFATLLPVRSATPLLIWKKRRVQAEVVEAFVRFVLEHLDR